MTSTGDLVALARSMALSSDRRLGSSAQLAATILLRQALEHELDRLWAVEVPQIRECSMRAQLVCLETFLADRDLARDARFAWTVLSGAIHYRAYELPPSAAEIERLCMVVARLATTSIK